MAKKKPVRKKKSPSRSTKPAAKSRKKPAVKKKKSGATKPTESKKRSIRGGIEAAPMNKGRGSRTAGQSGDVQGLSEVEDVDSESVEELSEEGQGFEASVISGVESADDEGEVKTHEVPEDDVPPEYREPQ